MRQLLFPFAFLISFSMISCSDGGTTGDDTQMYDVSVSIAPSDGGSVSPSDTTVEAGTALSLEANPANEYEFLEWTGDMSSSDNPTEITVDNPKEVTAVFEEFPESPFEGGDGSEAYPYEVSTLEQLQKIRDYPTKHFVQINDINASETSSWNDGKGFNPIGEYEYDGDNNRAFTGSFNGDGYVINGLTIDRPNEDGVGLFAYVGSGSTPVEEITLENLSFKDVSITGKKWVGALYGQTGNAKVEIHNSRVTGEVSGAIFVGGLAGNPYIIYDSYANCTVTGEEIVGGLYGSQAIKVKNSYSQGSVEGTKWVGGLAGRMTDPSVIVDSYSTADIIGDFSVGGLVGEMEQFNGDLDLYIKNSYAEGNIEGDSWIGGLVGVNKGGDILNSYSKSKVTGNYALGGLVGFSRTETSKIDSSYATGNVIGKQTEESHEIGGLVGINNGKIFRSTASGNIQGVYSIGGLVGQNGYDRDGIIENSYASGGVTGDELIGGLVGFNDLGEAKKSFSTGEVTGNKAVGGFIGLNEASITSSYWDVESSGKSNGVGTNVGSSAPTGLTTSEMTGSSAEDNMTDFDWTEIWVTTDSYPALLGIN